jgi:hypothetical protein
MDSPIEEPPPKKAKIMDRRLEELYHQDMKQFVQGPQFSAFFYHAEKPFPIENVSSLEKAENLVGIYDLIYTTGHCEDFYVNREITGTMTLYKTPDNAIDTEGTDAAPFIWGEMECNCTQANDSTCVFERDFSFVQKPDASLVNYQEEKDILKGYLHSRLNGYDGFPEAYEICDGPEWLQGLPWCMHRFTEDYQCHWSPGEIMGDDDDELEFPEERREFIKRRVGTSIEQSWLWKHFELPDVEIARKIYDYIYPYSQITQSLQSTLQLKKGDLLLYVQFDDEGENWTKTVARRRPDNMQRDRKNYIRPLPLADEDAY